MEVKYLPLRNSGILPKEKHRPIF